MTNREEARLIFEACKMAFNIDNKHHHALEASVRNLNNADDREVEVPVCLVLPYSEMRRMTAEMDSRRR